MTEPAEGSVRIDDPHFRRAVELLDAGDAQALCQLVVAQPSLARARAEEDGSFAGAYFARPRLLWFVAENPIRNGRLPDNIAELTASLIEVLQLHAPDSFPAQLNETLALVASSRVAREQGASLALMRTLVDAGADPDSGIHAGLAHREVEACSALLASGATLTLPLAAGLGRCTDLQRLLPSASAEEGAQAMALASVNGQAQALRHLLEHGLDPNRFHPEGFHAHSTALHQAIDSGSLGSVCTLLLHAADPDIRDRIFGGDARGWAEHLGRPEALELLALVEQQADALAAMHSDPAGALRHPTAQLTQLLGLAALAGREPWVRRLVQAGADVNTTTPAGSTPHEAAHSHGQVELAAWLRARGARASNPKPPTRP